MKKKWISLLLSGLTVLSLSSCNIEKMEQDATDQTVSSSEESVKSVEEAGGQESGGETSTENTDTENTDTEDTKEGSSEQGTDDGGNSISGSADQVEESFLLNRWFSYDEPTYVINAKGDLQYKFDKEELKEKLSDKTIDYSSMTPYFVADGVLYFSGYEYPNDQYVNYVSAIDLKTFEIQRLWASDAKSNLSSADYYNGQVYLRVYEYDEAGNSKSTEVVFTKKKGAFEFTKEVNTLDNINKAGDDIYITTLDREDRNEYSYMAISPCLKECGFVIAVSGGVIRMIDQDGNITEVKDPASEDLYVNDFDKDFIVYTTRNDVTNTLKFYDVNTKNIVVLLEESDSFSYLGYHNGNVYFAENQSTEYGVQDEHIYQIDLRKGFQTQLYEYKDVPGVDIGAGLEGWRLIGDSIYFAAPGKDSLKWMKVDIKADQPQVVETDYTIKQINTFKYGTVQHASMVAKCADCGTIVEKQYGETFVLDGKYSANADKINTSLKSYLIDDVLKAETEVKVSSDICKEHQNADYDFNPYMETMSSNITDVNILNDKYLIVDTDGYWYGGGAHGLPTRGQYVYDLETGDEKRLADFYSGTEEDFRKLVATKVKEDFESYSENGYAPYFAETAQDAYDQAYDITDLKTTMVEFREDGAHIIFSPYEMGPYAAGYIEIAISYEELLGRSSL